MKEYTVVYRDRHSEELEADGRKDLIRRYFNDREEKFKKEVERVIWNEISMQCTMEVSTGKIHSEIFTADVNPYGWRDARG